MRNFFDKIGQSLNPAADKVEDGFSRAYDGAMDALDRAAQSLRPAADRLEDGFADAKEALGNAKENLKPAAEKMGEDIAEAFGSAREKLGEHFDRIRDGAMDAFADVSDRLRPQENTPSPLPPETLDGVLDSDVDAQILQIRAAQHTPTSISEFISKKYGKDAE